MSREQQFKNLKKYKFIHRNTEIVNDSIWYMDDDSTGGIMKLKKLLKMVKEKSFVVISISDKTTYNTTLEDIQISYPKLLKRKVKCIYSDSVYDRIEKLVIVVV